MSQSVEQLILALTKEYEIYKDYYTLGEQKKEVLILGDIKELEKIISQEQDIIRNTQKIDQIRTAIIGNILFEQKINWIENITQLCEYIEDPYKEKILEIREKLSKLLEEIQSLNDTNQQLTKQQLEYIDFNINILNNAQVTTTYGNKTEQQIIKPSSLIDAKG
ncbi:flagellar protein FlgN [Inediibacterium massiliense]|uniref:flagellar protein FlgN n=1 Tax=Inediibacterium massiliense TaxID=1658111 RepID=UPI0006B633EA|nr:flagellar protein FlgN [Inediibacterium massiliense]